jgi:hypothetical protein
MNTMHEEGRALELFYEQWNEYRTDYGLTRKDKGYEGRFLYELAETKDRYERLGKFIRVDLENATIPDEDKELLREQYVVMGRYYGVLLKRFARML